MVFTKYNKISYLFTFINLYKKIIENHLNDR